MNDRNGSILVIRGLTVCSVFPNDRNRPDLAIRVEHLNTRFSGWMRNISQPKYTISLGSCESTSTIGATRSLLERHSEALAQLTVAGLTKTSSGADNYISAYESRTLRRRKRVLVEH